MEDIIKIQDFVSIYSCTSSISSGVWDINGHRQRSGSYGRKIGDGYGSGYGSGSGHEIGDGYGSGYGSGSGSIDGFGIGCGSSYNIKAINGMPVYMIDNVPTIINHVHGNIAKGAILKRNFTIEKCYIVKDIDLFAHGKTLREAMSALTDKLFCNMPEEERIAEFIKVHEWGKLYKSSDYYEWHHKLTGSCAIGRSEFAESHGYKLTDDELLTVDEFIKLTENSYGSSTIRKLKAEYDKLYMIG